MAGFLDALKESLSEHEVSLPVCAFKRTESFRVFYTYLEGRPLSHKLVFRKGGYPVFEIFLPRYGEDIERLIANAEYEAGPGIESAAVFGFPARLLLRLAAGRVVSGRALLTRTGVKIDPGPELTVDLNYRLAFCRRGTDESAVLVSSVVRAPGKNHSDSTLNWLKLDAAEWKELTRRLQDFLRGKEFGDVPKGPAAGGGPPYENWKRSAQEHRGGEMTARELINGKLKGLRYLPGISIGLTIILNLAGMIIREWWPVILFMLYSMIFCRLFALVKRRMGCPNCGRSLHSLSEEGGLAFTLDHDARFCPYCAYELDAGVNRNEADPQARR